MTSVAPYNAILYCNKTSSLLNGVHCSLLSTHESVHCTAVTTLKKNLCDAALTHLLSHRSTSTQ